MLTLMLILMLMKMENESVHLKDPTTHFHLFTLRNSLLPVTRIHLDYIGSQVLRLTC